MEGGSALEHGARWTGTGSIGPVVSLRCAWGLRVERCKTYGALLAARRCEVVHVLHDFVEKREGSRALLARENQSDEGGVHLIHREVRHGEEDKGARRGYRAQRHAERGAHCVARFHPPRRSEGEVDDRGRAALRGAQTHDARLRGVRVRRVGDQPGR